MGVVVHPFKKKKAPMKGLSYFFMIFSNFSPIFSTASFGE